MSLKKVGLLLLFIFSANGCNNPFAPALNTEGKGSISFITDLTTIDGVFRNLQFAYTTQDTIIYSLTLAEDFIFTYRDFDLGYDVSWGKPEEMKTTYGLFSNSEKTELLWNNIIAITQDSLITAVVRGFDLIVTFNPNDVVRIDGRVNLTLQQDESKNWRIIKWIDESNY